MPKRISSKAKHVKLISVQKPTDSVYQLWGWVLLIWSLYRHYLKLPEWADEFVFKPLVFVLPVIWYVRKYEKRSLDTLGLTWKNFFPSIYTGLGFGFLFAVEGFIANYLKYGEVRYNPLQTLAEYGVVPMLLLSLATAFSEELLCRGFLFTRIYESRKNLILAAGISALLFLLLHVPILVTTTKLVGVTLVVFIMTDIILGVANAFLMYNTGSLIAPILVHVFWNMTVAMYL